MQCLCLPILCNSGLIITALRLTASVVGTCYDYQLRSVRNVNVVLKTTIDLLRSLSDILHRLYAAMDDEDSNGLPLSSSILGISSTEDDSPLVQCTAKLHALEAILVSGNWPLNETELVNVVGNLTRLKVALEANARWIQRFSAEMVLNVPVISHLGPCQEIQMSLKEMLQVSINFSPAHFSVPINQCRQCLCTVQHTQQRRQRPIYLLYIPPTECYR